MKPETLQLNGALALFEDHLEDIKSACIDNIRAIVADETGIFREDFIRLRTAGLQRVLKRIVGIQEYKGSPRVGGITDSMIERAKEFPIEELHDGVVRHGMAQCPFHEDKTASMSFKRHNRYYCFGCGEKGSVIDYYMKMNKCNFIQAVRALQ